MEKEIHEQQVEKTPPKGQPGDVDSVKPTNAFLWLLATMPFFWIILQDCFIPRFEYAADLFTLLMNGIYASSDMYEHRLVIKTKNNPLMRVAAFVLPPIYLLCGHGEPSYGIMPYSLWCIGFIIWLSGLSAFSGIGLLTIGLIALLTGLITLFVYKEENEVAPESNTLKSEEGKATDISETLG